MTLTDWSEVVTALEEFATEATRDASRAVDTEDELVIQVEMTRMKCADLALERARKHLERMALRDVRGAA